MKLSQKDIKTLKEILKKIEVDQKNEKMRVNGRRKLQKQGKSLNKGKVKKQKRPLRSKKLLIRRRSFPG